MSAVCDAAGSPVVDAGGQPQRLLAIWPADQARLIDTWDGLGLRGTGSGDIEIADLFVPDDQVNPGFYGAPRYDRALFRMKEMPEVGHGAHALGVASAALESFVDAVNMKPIPGSTRHMAMGHMQAHQVAFARADVLVRAAGHFSTRPCAPPTRTPRSSRNCHSNCGSGCARRTCSRSGRRRRRSA